MALNTTELARRSMARAVREATELIKVTDLSEGDKKTSPEFFRIEPQNLFDVDAPNAWTFQRIGINDAAAIRIFRESLLKQLPATVVSNLQKNASFMNLQPGVAIGLVFFVVEAELDNV